jgi:dipeptidyl aminopeptidase/acylaminoacyl peptidase
MRALGVIASGVVAVSLAASGSANAGGNAFPGKSGRIAFVRVVAGSSPSGVPLAKPPTIYTLRPDGGGIRPLSTPRAYDYEPAWSPDGTMVAFRRLTDPPRFASSEIFVVRADGSGLERLTTNADAEKTPAWSPDGSRIAFERAGAVWVMRANGTHQRRLVAGAGSPAWSPDGRWIAYVRDTAIGLVRTDGTRRRRLGRSEYYGDKFGVGEPVEWTPDGRVAFVSSADGVTTMTTRGKVVSRLGEGRQPAWSPDGRRLVVTVFGNIEPYSDRLDVVGADGEGRRPLTRSTDPVEDFMADWQPVCTRRGTERRDMLSGTRRDELLCGLGGADVLDGGAGADRIFGGSGSDTILSRDGEFDVVGCGAGRDAVVADRTDLVGLDCEVRR